jgi:hypothetical protein
MMPTYLGENIDHTLKLYRALLKRLHFIEFYRIFSMFSVIKVSIVAVKLWYSKSARKNGYIYVIFNNFCWLLFFFKNSPLLPLRDRLMNNDIFGYNSVNPWRILLIFELDRDLYEIILCTKFHVNRISLSGIIV